jgi:cellulose biosynthesis protein BcsQ
MSIAIITKQRSLAKPICDYCTVPTKVYLSFDEEIESKAIIVGYNFETKEISELIKQLLVRDRKIFCILEPSQEVELKSMEYSFSYLINGRDSDDALLRFIYGEKDEVPRRSFVFISAAGGVGKTTLSSYLAKKVSEFRKVRLVDWNYQGPSCAEYFGIHDRSRDLTEAVIRLRNNLEVNLKDYEVNINQNLIISPMFVNYFESTKWSVKPFMFLWDEYEQESDVVIYEVPPHPFSVTSAIALVRGTDIVIPVNPEVNTIENTLALLKWIRMNREKDMPKIHLIVNKYYEEAVQIKEIEKSLGQSIEAVIPEIPNVWNLFISGELFEPSKMSKQLVEKVSTLHDWANSLELYNGVVQEDRKNEGGIKKWLSIKKTG